MSQALSQSAFPYPQPLTPSGFHYSHCMVSSAIYVNQMIPAKYIFYFIYVQDRIHVTTNEVIKDWLKPTGHALGPSGNHPNIT